jgi:hypothetical protein
VSRDDNVPSASGPSEAKIVPPVSEAESARQGTHLGREVHPPGGRGWQGFGGGATRFRLRERRWFHPEKSEAGAGSAFPFTDAETRQRSVLVHLENGKFRRRRSTDADASYRGGDPGRRRGDRTGIGPSTFVGKLYSVAGGRSSMGLTKSIQRYLALTYARQRGEATAGLQRRSLAEHKPLILSKLDNFLYKPKNSLATHDNKRRRI